MSTITVAQQPTPLAMPKRDPRIVALLAKYGPART